MVGNLQGALPVMDINRKASGCIVRLMVLFTCRIM